MWSRVIRTPVDPSDPSHEGVGVEPPDRWHRLDEDRQGMSHRPMGFGVVRPLSRVTAREGRTIGPYESVRLSPLPRPNPRTPPDEVGAPGRSRPSPDPGLGREVVNGPGGSPVSTVTLNPSSPPTTKLVNPSSRPPTRPETSPWDEIVWDGAHRNRRLIGPLRSDPAKSTPI